MKSWAKYQIVNVQTPWGPILYASSLTTARAMMVRFGGQIIPNA